MIRRWVQAVWMLAAGCHPPAAPFEDCLEGMAPRTAQPSTCVSEVAEGFVYSTIRDHTLGFTLRCGPDVDGNGIGDLAFNAASYRPSGDGPWQDSAVFRLDQPPEGPVFYEDADWWLRGGPRIGTPTIGALLELIDWADPPGLFFSSREGTSADLEGAHNLPYLTDGTHEALDVPDMFRGRTRGAGVGTVHDLFGPGTGPRLVLHTQDGVSIWNEPPEGPVWQEDAEQLLTSDEIARPLFSFPVSGDLDHDGFVDMVLRVVPVGGYQPGAPFLLVRFGPLTADDDNLTERAFRMVAGEDTDPDATLVRVGDVSGDGVDDLIIGSPLADDRDGWVKIHFGPFRPGGARAIDDADVILRPEMPQAFLGVDVAVADLDGDGHPALVVSAPQDVYLLEESGPGLVYVFHTPLSEGELTMGDAAWVLHGAQRDDSFGRQVESCDTDGDGRDELAISASYHDHDVSSLNGGRIYWLGEVDVPR